MLLIYSFNRSFCDALSLVYLLLNFSKRVLYVRILKSSSLGNFVIVSDNLISLLFVVICSTKLKNDSVFSSGDNELMNSNYL